DGPATVDELAGATGTHVPSLYRLLRALAGVGVFAEIEPRRFAQTAASACLASSHSASLGDAARMFGAEWMWRSWAALPYSIQTGRPAFDHVYAMDLWTYLEEVDPQAGALFDAGRVNMSAYSDAPIAAAYDFSTAGSVVDVGGGHGGLLAEILS